MLEKTDRKYLIVIILAICILSISLNFFISKNLSKTLEIKEIDSSITVSEKVGFDLNSSALIFGEVLRGGSSTKEIEIKNYFGFPIHIYVYGKDSMKDFITPFEEVLEKDENKTLKITASVPFNYNSGEYKGKVVIRIEKA